MNARGPFLIISSRRRVQAVHLYRSFGSTEIPVDKEKSPFERADIAFTLSLE